MTECFKCENDMIQADGCTDERTIEINGVVYDPIPYGDGYHFRDTDFEGEGRCHDCNVQVGEYHHPGCDMEECPECGGQYFICDCETAEKREIWKDAL